MVNFPILANPMLHKDNREIDKINDTRYFPNERLHRNSFILYTGKIYTDGNKFIFPSIPLKVGNKLIHIINQRLFCIQIQLS